MAKRKGESYLGGHTVVQTSPDWDEISRLEEKRAKASKEYRKALQKRAIHDEARKMLEDQKSDEST